MFFLTSIFYRLSLNLFIDFYGFCNSRNLKICKRSMVLCLFFIFYCFALWCLLGSILSPKIVVFVRQNLAKIDKKSLKNQQKNVSKKWSDFLSIFDRFLVDFGSILGSEIASKSNKNAIKKMMNFWIDFWSIFYRFWSVLGPQEGVHEGPANQLFEVILALGAKMAPRPPQDGPEVWFSSNFNRFLVDFAWFLINFWLIFDWFLIDSWLIF